MGIKNPALQAGSFMNFQSLLLRKLPQKVNPRLLAFIGEGFLFGPQNSLFWNLPCCFNAGNPLVA
jgi:hypothetical protein